MKKLLTILTFSCLLVSLHAQSDDGNYQHQYAKLHKAYAKNPDDVANLVAMASFYADSANTMRNLPLSMKYIMQAESLYVAMVEDNSHYKEVRRLIRQGITVVSVRQMRQQIYAAILQHLRNDNNIKTDQLNLYADLMKEDKEVMKLVESRRLRISYTKAILASDLDTIYAFLQKYPGTAEAERIDTLVGGIIALEMVKCDSDKAIDSIADRYSESQSVARIAKKQHGTLAYRRACKANTIEAYRSFLAQHPTSAEYVTALNHIETLLAQQYASLRTAEELADFIANNSENPLADDAMEQLRAMIVERHDAAATRLYLQNFPLDPQYNDIFRQFYDRHAAEGNLQPIASFAHNYPHFPFQQALAADLAVGRKVDSIDLTKAFTESEFDTYASHIYHLTGKKVSFVALQRTLQQLIANRNWSGAIERIRLFDLSFENDCVLECRELLNILSEPESGRHLTTEVRPPYSMTNPTPLPDGKHIIYNKVSNNTSRICTAKSVEGKSYKWIGTGEVRFSNEEDGGFTFFSLYDNGKKMLLGKDGDIWTATQEDSTWRITERFPAPLNSAYVETDARMMPDGSGMLIASDRPDGHNMQRSGAYFHGDTALASDLYFVPFSDGVWGEPVNLGLPVNSPYSERCPVMSRNLKTLYFITDAHGLGYGDIYVATRENVNDWQHWSQPVNLGKEVNSGFNEGSIALSHDERKMFVSTNRTNQRYCCYSFPTSHSVASQTDSLTIRLGDLSEPLQRLVVVESQRVLSSFDSLTQTSVTLPVYASHQYAIVARADGFFIPTTILDGNKSQQVSLQPTTLYQIDDAAKLIPLPLVTFEAGSARMQPMATVELEMLADFLADHPTARTTIYTHVQGSDDNSCYELSLQRAEAVRDYLALHGVDASRILISAYGNVNFKSGKQSCETEVRLTTR